MIRLAVDPEGNVHPSVLVAREKHDTPIWPASTVEEFAASCYAILKRFHGFGYYFRYDEPVKPAGLMAREQVEALPEGPVRDAAAKQVNQYVRELRAARANNETVDRIEAILAAGESPAREVRRRSNDALLGYESDASKVLAQRESHEYEEVRLERLMVVDTKPAVEKPHCNHNETPNEYFERTGVKVESNAEWNSIIRASMEARGETDAG